MDKCDLEQIIFRRKLAFLKRDVQRVFVKKSIQEPEIYILLKNRDDIPVQDVDFWTNLILSFRNHVKITIGDQSSWANRNTYLGWKEINL